MIPIYRILPFFIFISLTSDCFSQTIDTARYRKDALGSVVNQRKMIADGNNISTIIFNNGEIAEWPYTPSFEWPKGIGINYIDGLTLILSAEVITNKKVAVHPVETHYREEMDNPASFRITIPSEILAEPMGFNPIAGYFNPASSVFARSDDPTTWPEKWPSALNLPESQNGKWINRLFPFSQPANLETFYVMDDSKDFEFTWPLLIGRGYYYPLKSQELDSSSPLTMEGLRYSYRADLRKGLGLRVEAGTFQWNTNKLKNTLFVINDIYNLSDYSYEKFLAGIYSDSGIGGSTDSEGGEIAYFDTENNLAVLKDYDNKVPGRPDIRLGNWGIAFLETPGNSVNGQDDDNDGIINESQNNGLDDDSDWDKLVDDVGTDGVANTADLGEGDGIPTLGEPNFDTSDVDEIDMLRINSFAAIPMADKGPESFWPKNDEYDWNILNSNKILLFKSSNNIQLIPSTNGFSLPVRSKIRFSYAIVFGADSLDLVRNVKWAREAYSAGFTESSIGVGVGVKESQIFPNKIQLNQNYPNPFNPNTKISFNLPVAQNISLKVYDLLGREIQTLQSGYLNAGTHQFNFNGSQLTSGVYFFKLVSGNFSEKKKMVLMK